MRIRILREARGMTQGTLGTAMGTAQNVISQWENEVSLPKARQLPLLAQVLGCTIDDLFEPIGEAAG